MEVKPKLVLIASEIASITKHNPYVALTETLHKVHHRNPWLYNTTGVKQEQHFNSGIDKKLSTLDTELKQKIKMELAMPNATDMQLSKKIHTIVGDAVNIHGGEKSSKEVLQKNATKAVLDSALGVEIEHECRKRRGTACEKRSLDRAEISMRSKIAERNSKMYNKKLFEHDMCDVWIFGKMDGRDDRGNVVETKNRRNRLFSKIPSYEKVQLEMYMWMTSTKECTHIELHDDRQNIVTYHRDDELWKEICLKINLFVDSLFNATIDEVL